MTKTILKKWLKELRSGKYKQCKTSLRQKNGEYSYCALGILNLVLGQEFTEEGRLVGNVHGLVPVGFHNQLFTEMTETETYRKNDTGKNFEEIADWLEKTLLK